MPATNNPSELTDYAMTLIRVKAKALCRRHGFLQADFEDLQQELTAAVLESLPRFDSEKSTLNTYVSRVVRRNVNKLFRYRRRNRRDFRRIAMSVHETVRDECGTGVEMIQTVTADGHAPRLGIEFRTEDADRELRMDVDAALVDLPADLLDLAKRLKTKTVKEVARDLGIPRSTLIENGLAQLREILAAKGLAGHV